MSVVDGGLVGVSGVCGSGDFGVESIILRRALRFLRSPSPGRSRTAPTGLLRWHPLVFPLGEGEGGQSVLRMVLTSWRRVGSLC